MQIEPAAATDLAAIKQIAVDTALFEAEEVGVFDEMFAGALDGSHEGHVWLVLRDGDGVVAGAAYYAPEPFSDRVWNLYFLAVAPGVQGSGGGRALVETVESALRVLGEDEARVLIVETSGLPSFVETRAFYQDCGFDEEARIRQYYGPDDDKVVFWKSLV